VDACGGLIDLIAGRAAAARPLLVGIAGAVAVGKTTIAAALADGLARRQCRAEVLSTDAFLLPNATLQARGLQLRKGFPESYDGEAMRAALAALRRGGTAAVPIYSHDVYDIVPGAARAVGPADVILLEGVTALQPPAAELLAVAVYVEADEADVRAWFVARFLRLAAAAAADASSFYHPFAALPPEQLEAIAAGTWDAINAPNLHQHIAPSAARADVVVRKAADHAVVELRCKGLFRTAVRC
jgi:type I pantothenate kinase